MTTNTIVVGIDGSENSQTAVAWAAEEAQRRGTSLTFLHARVPHAVGGPYGTTRFPQMEDLERAGERLLADASDHARGLAPGVTITTEFTLQAPVRALIDASETAELVVVGSRGRSAVLSLALGSVSLHLAAHASSPVVIVRGDNDVARSEGPVVVGVDGSSSSETAVGFAFEEAASRGTTLIALYARDDDAALTYGMWEVPIDYLEELGRTAQRDVSDALAKWREKYPDVEVQQQFPRAHPVPALLSASKAASLMVLGSHGRGEFLGMLLGSVGAAVIRDAHSPVVIVR